MKMLREHLPVMLLVYMYVAICQVNAHGRLWDPPSRSSLWRQGFDSPVNYQDNELFCGGFQRQHEQNGGRCGLCGDPWDGARENEAGGTYATGIISRAYQEGQVIDITVDLTANHMGWFEFYLCPMNNPLVRASDECFERYPLHLADGSARRWHLPGQESRKYTIAYQLPIGVRCSQCVLQWRYNAGNSWGEDPETGYGCIGCGAQENFRGCADIAISETPVIPITGSPTLYPRTTPAQPRPSTTPTEPTPKPWPTEIGGVRCHSIDIWEGFPGMDEWCEDNCSHFPPLCPEDRCECWRDD